MVLEMEGNGRVINNEELVKSCNVSRTRNWICVGVFYTSYKYIMRVDSQYPQRQSN